MIDPFFMVCVAMLVPALMLALAVRGDYRRRARRRRESELRAAPGVDPAG